MAAADANISESERARRFKRRQAATVLTGDEGLGSLGESAPQAKAGGMFSGGAIGAVGRLLG
jgi:hypothetical protein